MEKSIRLIFDCSSNVVSNHVLPAPINNITEIQIDKVVIPNTQYNVRSGYNNVSFVQGSTFYSSNVSNGLYTSTQLASAVQIGMSNTDTVNDYTVSYSTSGANAYKMTFSASQNFTIYASSTIAPQLGITVTPAQSTTIISNAATEAYLPYYLLRSVALSRLIYDNVFNTQYKPYIEMIPNSGTVGGYTTSSQFTYPYKCSKARLNNCDFALYNPDETLVDSNGLKFRVELVVKYIETL